MRACKGSHHIRTVGGHRHEGTVSGLAGQSTAGEGEGAVNVVSVLVLVAVAIIDVQ